MMLNDQIDISKANLKAEVRKQLLAE